MVFTDLGFLPIEMAIRATALDALLGTCGIVFSFPAQVILFA